MQGLEYNDKPDYAMLAGLLERCMKRRGVKESDPYDWEKPATAAPVSANLTNNTASPAALALQPNITNATDNHTTHLDNDQENIEPDNRKEIDVSDWISRPKIN